MSDEDLRELERTDPERAKRFRARFGYPRCMVVRIPVLVNSRGGFYASRYEPSYQSGWRDEDERAAAEAWRWIDSIKGDCGDGLGVHLVWVEAVIPLPEDPVRLPHAHGEASAIVPPPAPTAPSVDVPPPSI